MEFTELALRMYPYWIMGIFMLCVTYFSKYRYLIRIDWNSVAKWGIALFVVTLMRFIVLYLFRDTIKLSEIASGATTIPWQASLTVFWEDACHTLPLAILSIILGQDKLWKRILIRIAIVAVMISFGLGHVYQGYTAAILLSFYIPFTLKKGMQLGFGTMMIAHTMYDLVTMLTLHAFLG